uniref:NADH-ubiquinone oxidoreductase chain 4L n=1 Tax=Odontophrynus occidentalis TaxID=326981 RepID=S4V294_9NEOB|nr:NADH dehydrogenase subunit 4L [Odontophrynus occidentalis]
MTITHEIWLLYAMFFLCLFGYSFNRLHLLSTLLCLEGMMLTMFIGLTLWSVKMAVTFSMMYPVIMLTMSACEAGLGLSLMIATTRSHGTDNLKSLNLLQC